MRQKPVRKPITNWFFYIFLYLYICITGPATCRRLRGLITGPDNSPAGKISCSTTLQHDIVAFFVEQLCWFFTELPALQSSYQPTSPATSPPAQQLAHRPNYQPSGNESTTRYVQNDMGQWGTLSGAPLGWGTPRVGHPQWGTPRVWHPQWGTPRVWHPQWGTPRVGHPQWGTPRVGHPQWGTPRVGHPHPLDVRLGIVDMYLVIRINCI